MTPDHVEHPVLAIDYGLARVGVAATDDFGLLAHPVETIEVKSNDVATRVKTIIDQRRIKTLLIGLPLRLSGEEGDAAENARELGQAIHETCPDIPLIYVDERFTTVTASEKLHAAGRNTRKQKSIIDQAAAVEILNTWLGW